MRKLISLIFLLNQSFCLFSQEVIDPQRPTLTESATIIDPKMIQSENGITWINDTMGYSIFARIGLTERLEFRVSSELASPFLAFSGKVVILKPKKWQPGTSFTLWYDPFLGTQDYRLSLTNSIGKKWFYTFNAGNDNQWYGIVLLGHSLSEKIAVFAEQYFREAGYQQQNTGITYRITNDIQVDAFGGVINYFEFYAGAGFSFRLK